MADALFDDLRAETRAFGRVNLYAPWPAPVLSPATILRHMLRVAHRAARRPPLSREQAEFELAKRRAGWVPIWAAFDLDADGALLAPARRAPLRAAARPRVVRRSLRGR